MVQTACRYNLAYPSFDAVTVDTENTWKVEASTSKLKKY